MLAICESCSLHSSLSRSLARGCFFNKRRVPRSQILSSSSSRRQLVTWPSYSKSAWASNRLYPLPSALDSCRKSQYSHIGPGGASIHIDTLEPPGPVHGWPTPLLSREDWMKYSRPLEARGWRVAQIDHISDKPLDCTLLSNSELKMTIVFREEDFEKNSEQFISVLSSLEKEENVCLFVIISIFYLSSSSIMCRWPATKENLQSLWLCTRTAP